MGTVRLLLALAVVATHAGLNFSVRGELAVQLFYMVSGFLISFILVERRSYVMLRHFYLSRYLRLFPVYAIVALATALAYLLAQPSWYAKFAELPASALVLLGVSNATLFLQDTVMFTGIEDGRLVPMANFLKSEVPLFTGLLVPQAWSLSLELMFYLIAPFVLKRWRVLIALLIASLAVRVGLLVIGIGHQDPWSYRFFPAELSLFLIGALSHQVLLPRVRRLATPGSMQAVFALVAIALVAATWMPVTEGSVQTIVLSVFAVALPFLFLFQNTSKLDHRLAELSYPVYINHMLTLNVCEFVLGKVGMLGGTLAYASFFIAPVAVAFALNVFIAEPIDAWRRRLRRGEAVGLNVFRIT